MPNKIVVVYTTVASLPEAEKMAEEIVISKLAACVNIIPQAISIYEWQGKLEKTTECLMIVKTSVIKAKLLYKWLLEHHPYDTPAIIKITAETSKEFNRYVTEKT